MNGLIWALQIVLTAVFFMAGAMKLMKPKEEIQEKMAWVEDFDGSHIRAIGALEVLAAVGLIVPAIFGIGEPLVGWAAVGLVLLMLGAAVTHARRGEYSFVAMNVALAIAAAVVAWGRFGDYAL